MNRSSFALTVLLVALAGPLLLASSARSQSLASSEVCTPPRSPVHPADLFGLLPYPGYLDDFADAAAASSWGTPTPDVNADAIAGENIEDWRDFETFGPETSAPSEPITGAYDDLFETLRDVASNTIAALKPLIEEVNPSDYKANVPEAPIYDPYAELPATEESVEQAQPVQPIEEPAAEATTTPYPSPEAYESEFSGYGTTDYLRDNFGYEPVKEFDLEKIVASRPLHSPVLVSRLWNNLLDSQLVTDSVNFANEAYATGHALASQVSIEQWIDASELAWDRLEEHRRSTEVRPQTIALSTAGFRLPDDHCGWDCDYNWRDSITQTPAVVENRNDSTQNRAALLTLAQTLRTLAGQLESASEWLAKISGHDVAEVEAGSAAR